MLESPLVKFLIIYAAASAAGWLFACIGISGMRDTWKREARETCHTTGKAVEHVRYRKRSRRRRRTYYYTYWRSVVAFTAEGKAFRAEGVLIDGRPAVGETVDIWYDPDDPTHFHQAGQLERHKKSDALVTAAGILWARFSIVLAIKAL